MKVTRESKGFQSGRLDRMVLLPRLPAVFLHAVNQPRFAFTKGGGRTIKGVKTVEVKFRGEGLSENDEEAATARTRRPPARSGSTRPPGLSCRAFSRTATRRRSTTN